MSQKYKAMILSCIDPRFQPIVFNFLNKKNLKGKYSSFTIAGAAIGVTSSKFKKWHKTFLENVSISIKLHKIKKIIVINHRDCGAAKIINKKKDFNKSIETQIHIHSFKKIKKILKRKFSNLKVETFLVSLNKKIEKFK
tara:strand:- start:4398 stop:4814 length:417 start_codon:yes stop_codon:yes gene_type:complete